jgi:hypothetical protein
VLGHLIRVQTQSALDDLDTAGKHADAADELAARHEIPLVAVFTDCFRAMRRNDRRVAESLVDRAGMPGLTADLRTHAMKPACDAMAEIRWCRIARAAVRDDDRAAAAEAREALRPAAHEHAANGLLTEGPIRDVLAGLDRYIDV